MKDILEGAIRDNRSLSATPAPPRWSVRGEEVTRPLREGHRGKAIGFLHGIPARDRSQTPDIEHAASQRRRPHHAFEQERQRRRKSKRKSSLRSAGSKLFLH